MCAAQAGKLELVQELLDRGADIKAIDEVSLVTGVLFVCLLVEILIFSNRAVIGCLLYYPVQLIMFDRITQ